MDLSIINEDESSKKNNGEMKKGSYNILVIILH